MKITITLFLLTLTPVLLIEAPVYAGSSFATLSMTTNVIAIKNAEEINRIIEQVNAARAASQRALSNDEIAKIKDQAQQAQDNQAMMIVDAGATIFCGSHIIE